MRFAGGFLLQAFHVKLKFILKYCHDGIKKTSNCISMNKIVLLAKIGGK